MRFNMVRLLINAMALLLVLSAGSTLNAEIYKSRDADGNVIFTDVPTEKSEKVDLPDVTTFKSQPYKPIQRSEPAATDSKLVYDIKLVQPANKETVRDNNGDIPIEVEINPRLKREHGHHVLLWLDDQQPVKFTTNRYQLSNIDRGTHTVSVKVVDGRGKAISATQTNTVHLHRHSANFNARPGPRPGIGPR